MISTQSGPPPTRSTGGFKPDDVAAGKYGQQTARVGFGKEPQGSSNGRSRRHGANSAGDPLCATIPREEGFVGAALSSAIWHFTGRKAAGRRPHVEVDASVNGWPFPVPGVIPYVVLSMDDRFLYFGNWLHGDLRQYDVTIRPTPG